MNLFKKTSEPEEVEGNKSRNIFFHLIVGLLVFIIILAIILTIIVFLYLFFDKKYVDRIYPGVHFQEISLSGLTKDGANEVLKNKIKKINDSGVSFFYEDANAKDEKVTRKTTVYPLIASFSGDIAYQVMDFDLSKTVDQAFSIGRSKNPIEALYEKANSYYYSTNIDLVASVNEAQIRQVLQDYFKQYEKPAKNAELIQEKDSRGSIFYSVSKEENGYVIDYDNGINQLKSNLVGLKVTSIELKSMVSSPQVYQADGLRVAEKANSILSFAPFALYFEEYPKFKIPSGEWIVSRDDWADWLLVKKGSSSEAMIGLNEKAQDYLKTKILPKINIEPTKALLQVKDGKVVEFQTGTDGLTVDMEATLKNIEERILQGNLEQVGLAAADKKIKIESKEVIAERTQDVDNMGIKELIGVGKSTFNGSPANRRHNIKKGASSINGIIIQPGEEFSLIKALGKIDASNDYLPELVIKSGKTMPEFGGGLCQVGTTLFRSVVNAGLPVTERLNHSYRVPYYEPAGTDATIYDPWPDFKFKNDTNKYLLIQTFMEGSSLRFELWGTKDGRVASSTYPVIYNIVQPEPKKIIETADLKPGEEKCTEKAHAGADAYFDYSVVYPNGESKERRFKSHYVPWQEVCLFGVATSTEANLQKASSTKEIIITATSTTSKTENIPAIDIPKIENVAN